MKLSNFSVYLCRFCFLPNYNSHIIAQPISIIPIDVFSRVGHILRRHHNTPSTAKFRQKCLNSREKPNRVDAIFHVLSSCFNNAIMSCQRLLHIRVHWAWRWSETLSLERGRELGGKQSASGGSAISLWQCRYRWDLNNASGRIMWWYCNAYIGNVNKSNTTYFK